MKRPVQTVILQVVTPLTFSEVAAAVDRFVRTQQDWRPLMLHVEEEPAP